MRVVKNINLLFVFAIAMVVGACVPKASDKKATCGKNEAFNSVTRSCYSITEIRYKPVATTSSESLTQETPKSITLGYTDKNSDTATSCRVTGISSNLEVMSPLIINGGLFTQGQQVLEAASDLANAVPATDAVNKPIATAAQLAAEEAFTRAEISYSYDEIFEQIGVFKSQVDILVALAASFPSAPSVQFYYNLTQSRLLTFDPLVTMAENRCECAAGICTATLIPRINQSGTGGFTYTVTDVDGVSNAKTVSTTITALPATTSHLKPVAESSYEIFAESATSTASNYTFILPSGGDLSGTTVFRYAFNGTKNGSNQGVTTAGKVWGCMDLDSSSGPTDVTCTYSPNNGDAFYSGVVDYARVNIDDLNYEALETGTYGNSITIQYYNLQNSLFSVDPYLIKTQLYGMVSATLEESFVRVVGNAIKVYINPDFTSSASIRDLINSHPQTSKLVYVTGGSASNFPSPAALTPSAVSLSGGVDAFDKVPFTVSNGGASSTNTASVLINMTSTDDVPVMNFAAATTATVNEDTSPFNVTLTSTFTDVDTDGVYTNVCNVDPLDAIFLANFTVNSCTCVLTACTVNISPNGNVSSTTPFTFAYRIGSFDGASTQYTAYRNFSLTMKPINDAPTMSALTNQTIAESTSTVPNSGFIDITVGPGGGGFETSQTLTLTATSSDTTLLPDANLVVTTPSTGVRRLTFTPVVNRSGAATVTVKLKDNGGTADAGVDETTSTFILTVTPVDDPPYFISIFSTVDTNEGGAVQTDGIQIDEDMGSSPDEDAQSIKITALTSDNPTVLPTSGISFFYDLNDNGVLDTGESRALNADLESTASDDVKSHKLYFKLSPVNGVDGNTNISFTINDGTTAVVKIFSLVVHPIASLHGGWENISAIGLKTDKNGNPVTEEVIQCNYNTIADAKACSGSSCQGTSAPHGVIVPDAANVIFYDSANKKCYRSTSASQFSWVDLKTSCPITRQTGVCSDNNCISTSVPTPTFVGQYHYDTDDGTCSVSTNVSPAVWETHVPSKITLAWKPFTIAGSGADSGVQIAGWNVYRREVGTDYNLKGGHLKNTSSTTTMTITDPSVRTFTDNTATAGKVYYYLVRPVDNRRSLPTYTPEIYSEVRVAAPTKNYVFVHRWMINQEICNSMNMTTSTTNRVDPTSNFRCPYSGPGESSGYYDYGTDLLVDMQEMGCAYAPAPKCSADGCIGIGAPSSTSGGVTTNDMYYDRSTGSCYVYNGAWTAMNSATAPMITATVSALLNSSLNAPIVNVTQAQASMICSGRPDQKSIYAGLTGAGVLTPKLPSKKDFIAYSAHSSSMNDSDISDLEQGFSLNIQSRCNGSAASGLETAYSDSTIPSTSFMYTLPGTAASGIRSLVTGSIPLSSSKSTESCVSRYGVQDVYGNVAEWTTDQMTCASKVCTPTGGSSMSYDFDPTDDGNGATSTDVHPYAFDLITGPYSDVDNSYDGADFTTIVTGLDAYITDWTLGDEMYEAGKFSLPTGMPISNNISTTSPVDTSPAIPFLLDIGSSAGITISKLHDDAFILNGVDGTGSFAVGGSFASGARSGRWTTELIPSTSVGDDVGFRCVVPVPKTTYPADTAHIYPY